MSIFRINLLRDLYPTSMNVAVEQPQLILTDEEAFGLSKFVLRFAQPLKLEPATLDAAAELLLLEQEPRIASFREVDGDIQVAYTLTSVVVVRKLLSFAADPQAPMFTGCRRFVQNYRNKLAAYSGLYFTVRYQSDDR